MVYKKFDRQLYLENDKKGKDFATKVLSKMFPDANIVEGGKYAVDLRVVSRDTHEVLKYVEVEVRNNWKDDFDFPFPTVNIPERKRKFFNGNCLYFSINKNCTRCMVVEDRDILDSPLEENRNKYISSGEKFFSVPVSKFKSIKLEH